MFSKGTSGAFLPNNAMPTEWLSLISCGINSDHFKFDFTTCDLVNPCCGVRRSFSVRAESEVNGGGDGPPDDVGST